MNEELLLAGVVGTARGLKGEVFVEVRTDRADEVFEVGSQLQLEDAREGTPQGVPQGASAFNGKGLPSLLTVEMSRVHSGRQILRFEEVQTREQAEAIRGLHLMTEPSVEEDAWYPSELEGLEVFSIDGEALGKITGLAQGAAHDFLLVDHEGSEVLVPLVSAMVPEVDIDQGRVVVDVPGGLFE